MSTLTVSPNIVEYLHFVDGQTLDEKVLALIESYVTSQLRDCESEISTYEVKYRAVFSEFVDTWNAGSLPDKYSHHVERDYMEWEGLEAEKKRWMDLLKRLPPHQQNLK